MIRKLQNRFARIAVLVLTAAMVTVVGIINTANLVIVRSELAGTVRELAENSIPDRGPKHRAARNRGSRRKGSPAGSRKKETGAG